MAIPRFDEFLTDTLKVLSDGEEWRSRDAMAETVRRKNLTPEELSEMLPSGQTRAENRAFWAQTYLFQAGAITRPARGVVVITELGRQLLVESPDGVTLARLRETDGMKDWDERTRAAKAQRGGSTNSLTDDALDESGVTPEEQIAAGIQQLQSATASELLRRLQGESADFMERAVLRVLQAMGYGNGDDDIQHLGGMGDGGVDGVINQDKLGLDQIYVQAKRYADDNVVGPGAIRDFNTAVQTKKATKGVFITTSRFSRDAREVLRDLPYTRIILIDGHELANLMLEHGVGVTADRSYKVFSVDENFFDG